MIVIHAGTENQGRTDDQRQRCEAPMAPIARRSAGRGYLAQLAHTVLSWRKTHPQRHRIIVGSR